jgi:hypothetical protein
MTPVTDVFLQRPNYRLCQAIDIKVLRNQAIQLSQQGSYCIASLWLFRKVWQRSKKTSDYIAYLVFRRALGYLLTPTKVQTLQTLSAIPQRWLSGVYGHRWRQVQMLKAEYDFYRLQKLSTAGIQNADQHLINQWRNSQNLWQQQLAQYLETAFRVQLVGNSPKLRGSNLGNYIDTADRVIRFNHYFGEHCNTEDTGRKCDLWVIAPGFRSTFVPECEWILLSGPNMLWWQQQWAHLKPLSKKKLLSVPLEQWRHLVRQLAAPPSAGLLTLEYISALPVEISRIKLAGFGYNPDETQDYHLALPEHKATSRHNWQAEYRYLQRWLDNEGSQ